MAGRILIVFILFISITASGGTDEAAAPRLITIRGGIKRVLEESHLVMISQANREIASQDTNIARSAFFPQLNASLSETVLTNQPAAKFGSQRINTSQKNFFSLGIDVYQTLFDFGKSYYGYKASEALLDSSRIDIERVKNLAVLEFITAYFDLLDADRSIAVSQSEAESLSSHLRDVETLYEEGVVVKNDLLSAKVRLSDAEQRLISSRNLRDNAAAKLNNILVIPINEEIAAGDFEMNLPDVPEIGYLFKTAEEQRPEIRIVDEQMSAAVLLEKSKLAKNYPEVFTSGGYSFQQNRFLVEDDNFSVKLGMKMNVFDGGLAKGDAGRERARRARLAEERKKLVDDIKLEVKNGHLGLKNASEKVKVTRDAVAQAAENVRIYREKYAEGGATSTEVLDSITMQTNARTNYYKADYELKKNYAKLMYSIGIDLALVYEKMEMSRDGEKQ